MRIQYNFICRLVMMLVMALSSVGAMAQQTYISDVYIVYGGATIFSSEDPTPSGYTKIDYDILKNGHGDYIYIAYKTTTDIKEAITDLIVVQSEDIMDQPISYNKQTYYPAGYSKNSKGGNLRQGMANSYSNTLYYTKEHKNDYNCQYRAITELKVGNFADPDYWEQMNRENSWRFAHLVAFGKDEGVAKIVHFVDYSANCIKFNRSDGIKHDLQTFRIFDPTCTTDGSNRVHEKCKVCGRCFTNYYCDTELSPEEVEIPALGHDWDKEKMTYDAATGAWNLDCKRCQYHEARKMMCITANEDNVTVRLNSEIDQYYDDLDNYEDYYEEPEVYYMKNGDGDSWYLSSDPYKGVDMNKGDMLWLFGRDTNEFYRNEENRTWFEIRGSVSCTGNVTSICDGTGDYGYLHTSLCGVFNSSGLDKSPRLNATNLYYDCYDGIFRDCPNLKDVTICDANKDQIEMAIKNDWLRGTASNGIVHITDELALANADLKLPANWRTDKVVVAAKEDPTEGQEGNYYATYFDSQSEYSVKEGTTAYTGIVDGNVLKMTAEDDNIIPAGEGVLLKGNTADVILTLSDTDKSQTTGNMLKGSDTDTTAPANCYIFTYAQHGLGFYQYAADKPLGAHKAYLVYNKANSAKGFRMVFDDEDTVTSIVSPLGETEEGAAIYNLQGVRMNKLQKGINIVNGKKIVVK